VTATDSPADSCAGTSAEYLVEVKGLKTYYQVRRGLLRSLARRPEQRIHAVDGISFGIRPGEMLALVGESGCGKTSAAQTLLRMVQSSSGTIRFQDQDITRSSHRGMRPLRRRMQVIYQDPYESLDPRFRVRQTIEEPMLVHGIGSSRSARARLVADALEQVELAPAELYLDRFPHELSGGQRQRVAIAAALVLSPLLLVADEPVSMLDVSVRAGVLELLDRLRRDRNMAVLMITHDLSTAAHFANRIAVMYLGRIVEEGPAKQVIQNPLHPYTKALLSVVPSRDPLLRTSTRVLRGETPNPVTVPPGCRFHPRCPIAEERCRMADVELRRPAQAEPEHHVACQLA
jgi:oligopeptide/dipeptide ABC transporter ATP-binding protein